MTWTARPFGASSSNVTGVRAHTFSSATLTKVTLNGVEMSEGSWNAAIAGHFNVPVVMASGDDAAIAEIRKLVGNIEGVETKRSLGFHSALTLTPQAVQAVKNFRLGPLYTPPSLIQKGVVEGTLARPSTGGGANWSGAAVDPERGILYVPSRNQMAILRLTAPQPEQKSTLRMMEVRGAGLAFPSMPQGLPLFKPPYSRMTAIDMNTGEHLWMAPLGNGDNVRQHPLLRHLNLPPVGGDSTMSGPLLTKTLLISALTRGGRSGGPRLVARDKATGREIASVDLPGLTIGTPMTYALGGKQYIALTVAAEPVPELVAFTLP